MASQTPTRLHTREPEPAIPLAANCPAARPGTRRQTDTTDSGGNPAIASPTSRPDNRKICHTPNSAPSQSEKAPLGALKARQYHSPGLASEASVAPGSIVAHPLAAGVIFAASPRKNRDSGSPLAPTPTPRADNRRVKKDLAAGADVEYAYDGWLTLEEFDEGQSALKRQYVHGRQMDELVLIDVNLNGDATASGAGDARYFYHQNLIQSVGALSDASGAIVEAYEYDPYGRHILIRDGDDADSQVSFGSNDVRTPLGVSATGSPFTFTGRDYDPEIDKHHYRNRAYSWQAERFISRDLIGYASGSANQYCYSDANPIILIDPLGLAYIYFDWQFSPHPFALSSPRAVDGWGTLDYDIKVECSCSCDASGAKLNATHITLILKPSWVRPEPSVNNINEVQSLWAKKCEILDHGADLHSAGIGKAKEAAEKMEKKLRERKYARNQVAQCKSDCQSEVKSAFKKKIDKAYERSLKKHDGGLWGKLLGRPHRHAYYWPKWGMDNPKRAPY